MRVKCHRRITLLLLEVGASICIAMPADAISEFPQTADFMSQTGDMLSKSHIAISLDTSSDNVVWAEPPVAVVGERWTYKVEQHPGSGEGGLWLESTREWMVIGKSDIRYRVQTTENGARESQIWTFDLNFNVLGYSLDSEGEQSVTYRPNFPYYHWPVIEDSSFEAGLSQKTQLADGNDSVKLCRIAASVGKRTTLSLAGLTLTAVPIQRKSLCRKAGAQNWSEIVVEKEMFCGGLGGPCANETKTRSLNSASLEEIEFLWQYPEAIPDFDSITRITLTEHTRP